MLAMLDAASEEKISRSGSSGSEMARGSRTADAAP